MWLFILAEATAPGPHDGREGRIRTIALVTQTAALGTAASIRPLSHLSTLMSALAKVRKFTRCEFGGESVEDAIVPYLAKRDRHAERVV